MTEWTASTEVTTYLAELRKVEEGLHRHEADRDAMVREARRKGATWTEIGDALGVTKQTAWERFRETDSKEAV